ncbi:asl2942 [Nostoc sp. PCC 7120 = FACHB-418]|nr:asl2942 [Nostoc sp. PCC 7120 = FACHB-418]
MRIKNLCPTRLWKLKIQSIILKLAIHLLELTATNSSDRTHSIYSQQFIHSISANWSSEDRNFVSTIDAMSYNFY